MPHSSLEVFSPRSLSEIATIGSVLVKHPRDAFGSQRNINRHWKDLNYTAPPNLQQAIREFDVFESILEKLRVVVHRVPSDPGVGLDSIYVRDTCLVCRAGIVLTKMSKRQRGAEPEVVGRALDSLGIPVAGGIRGTGRLEGGDLVWLDSSTLLVGRGYRTNGHGIAQLRELLQGHSADIIEVPLPHWKGPGDVFHLMSMLSPLDRDLLLVYSPLLPVPFRNHLRERGYRLIEVPEEEFESMGCNVLTLAPRVCIALSGNPRTRRRMEKAGVEVHTYVGTEISLKGSGGPTCLTRPLLRG